MLREIGAWLTLTLLAACVLGAAILVTLVAGGVVGIAAAAVAAIATFYTLRRVTGRVVGAALDAL